MESPARLHVFGRYEILRSLGRGMADVYLAKDPKLNCPVVLKIIGHSDSDSVRLAIEAEHRGARIQQQLRQRDRRILQIYDLGNESGCFFVVMEYFPGRTVAELLRAEHRIETKRAVRFAAELCNQLRALHRFVADGEGRATAVVHGDIKPSNIQIGENDELRLLDFGIAKTITPGHDLTHHQLGSPSYCSPERLSESQVGIQADLWSLGVSLFEMVTGSPPFRAQSTRELEKLIRSGRPPCDLPDDCPAGLKAILSKAMARDFNMRYESAEHFEADLRAFLEERPANAARTKASNWRSNATVRKYFGRSEQAGGGPAEKPVSRPLIAAAPSAARATRDSAATWIAFLAGVFAGLMLFIPTAYNLRLREIGRSLADGKDYVQANSQVLASDWELYQTLQHRSALWSKLLPTPEVQSGFEASLVASAENLITRYRTGADDALEDYDWSAARLCLLRALEIDPLNRRAKGELLLCDGFLNLRQNSKPATNASIKDFRGAAMLMPHAPEPHLGLARAYVYRFHNVGAALAEFHQAEQVGYRLGPRELEQQGDAYLFRAEWELNSSARQDSAKWLRLARGDFERARNLYEPIAGFCHVDTNLERVETGEADSDKREAALLQPRPTKPHLILLKVRYFKKPGPYRWR
ncbi:MAG: serine/threonine protein kinase [Acidobacteriota bacterium]|nr:serine/threonine protein kinase [Acidobacteriota bacterium]